MKNQLDQVLEKLGILISPKEWKKLTPSEKKTIIQRRAVEKWRMTAGKGTLEFATGVGKTFAAIRAILDFRRGSKILFLAEVTDREDTIKADIKKFDKMFDTDILSDYDVTFACYQSAYKWKDRIYDLVIADEVHDSLTEQYHKFYENNRFSHIMGLSATVDRKAKVGDDDSMLTKGSLLDNLAPVCMKISQDDAIALELIAPYELLVYFHTLDEKEKTVDGGTKAKPFKTTEKAGYDYADSRFKKALYLNGKAKEFQIAHWARKRASILWKSASKAKLIKRLIDNIPTRYIIFGNDLDTLLSITPNVVCSRYSNAENETIKQNYATKKINEIGSFKKLKQGENLVDTNIAVLHSYYSKEKDFIQRAGRILRLDGKEYAAVVVFTTIGTKEHQWYKTMKENTNAPTVAFDDIDQLSSYLKSKLDATKSEAINRA